MMIKLPKAVGKDLDEFKLPISRDGRSYFSFDDYIMNAENNVVSPSYEYLQCELQSDVNQRYFNLLHAWIDGWEEE